MGDYLKSRRVQVGIVLLLFGSGPLFFIISRLLRAGAIAGPITLDPLTDEMPGRGMADDRGSMSFGTGP